MGDVALVVFVFVEMRMMLVGSIWCSLLYLILSPWIALGAVDHVTSSPMAGKIAEQNIPTLGI